MGGGTTSNSQNANGHVAFNPTSIGGGNISVGGSVGQGAVSQGQSGSATGAGVKLDVSIPPPVPVLLNLNTDVDFIKVGGDNQGAKHLNLINLASDVDMIRNGKGAHVDFDGNGKGLNHVGSIDAQAGSLTTFHNL